MSFMVKAINVGEYVLLRYEGQLTTPEIEQSIKSVNELFDDLRWNKLLIDLRNMINRILLADVYTSSYLASRHSL